MGLSERLTRAAVRRPHVLVVPAAGHDAVRWEAEDVLDSLGWPAAASPAAADVLLCCGRPGTELAPYVDVAWQAMPGPRARATASTPAEVRSELLNAASVLADAAGSRQDARERPAPLLSAADPGPGGADDEHDGMDHDMGSGGMDHDMGSGGMDHSMHHGMGMDLPGGLVMADRVEDRDGLRLEGLNLSLGPVLPAWPAGVRLDVVLSGDVLVHADVVRLDLQPQRDGVPPAAVRALDALATLLQAAGWSDGALRARRARAAKGAGPATEDLLRRVRRARLLRWSLRGLPAPTDGDLSAHLDRLLAAVRGDAELPTTDDARLARDVVGLDVGSAALVVAAHGPLLPAGADV